MRVVRWPIKSPRKKTRATETPTRRNPDDQVLGELPEVAVDVPRMTIRDQSREDVSGLTSSLAMPRHVLRVGAWNVREVKRRWWMWLGHVLRMKKGRHPLEALSWAPPGKRLRGRPLGTWRRTIKDEMKTAGKMWNELRWLAQDRSEWKKFVGALCSPNGAPRIELS